MGDIHGRADLLEVLLGRIAAEAAQHPEDTQRRLIFLGDYIDRGASSRGVVERLLSDPLPGFTPAFETVRLLGNHEEALLDFLDERSDGLDWLSYGGLETLLSYGVPLKGYPDTPQRAAELRGALAGRCRKAISPSTGPAPCTIASATTCSSMPGCGRA